MSNFRLPYLIGNSKLRDVVSWPLINKADAITFYGGTPNFTRAYPIGVSRDTIQFWAWRVKSWTFAGRFSTTCVGNSIDTGDITQVQPFTKSLAVGIDINTAPDLAVSEEDLLGPPIDGDLHEVTKRSLIHGLRNWGAYTNAVNPTAPTYVFTLPNAFESSPRDPTTLIQSIMFDIATQNGAFPYVVFDPDTNLFYPSFAVLITTKFVVTSTFFGGSTPVAITAQADSRFYPASDPTKFAAKVQIDINLDGDTIDLPLKIDTFRSPGSGGGSETGSCEFTMVPAEFWPYQTLSGQPVYDTATGVQLNDPFS